MFTVILLALAPQVQGLPSLFQDTNTQSLPGVGESGVALRSRLVEMDLDLLENTWARTGNSGALRLNLFADEDWVIFFEKNEAAPGQGWVWTGLVEGDSDSEVFFSVTENVVMGSIRSGARLFRVAWAGNGVHRVSEIDESMFAGCGTGSSHAILGPSTSVKGNRSNPTIDVLVAYTTSAKNGQGGTNAMNSLINLAVTETNNGYSNSQVNQRLNLVHSAEMTGYTETSFSSMLSQLKSKSDGKLDNVHSLRDQYAADVVTLIVSSGAYCGIAYLMTNPSSSFQSSAFNVVSRSCATGYYSFGHELGHNMGSTHDRGNASSGAYPYSFGFRTSNNQYRTVLAYSPGSRINRYSNPNISYQGYVMGKANSEENWRSLNNTANIVSNFRISGPATPVLNFPTPLAGFSTTLQVSECDPGDLVILAYSLTGGGPTSTPYGSASLTPPITSLPTLTADANGDCQISVPVPGIARGRQVWLQAVDVTSGVLSNAENRTVL